MPVPSICWLIALVALAVLEGVTVTLVSLGSARAALPALTTPSFVNTIWARFAFSRGPSRPPFL